MNTVIFQTENGVFEFGQIEMRNHLVGKKAEYAPDEITQLLELFSTDASETFLNSDDHHYFEYVTLGLIGDRRGIVTCKLCGETYEVSQLKEFAIGHGKSPFDIKQEQKGGIRLFNKRKMKSMFGGKGYKCPAGHELIAIETWKT